MAGPEPPVSDGDARRWSREASSRVGEPSRDPLEGAPPTSADQHGVWTRIAASFDRTRTRAWPHVVSFLHGLPEGSRVLDLMAGNGRHAANGLAPTPRDGDRVGEIDGEQGLRPGADVIAVDWSRPLCDAAARQAPGRVLCGDATRLPLADGTFDAAILCAGLHGLPSTEGRAACLREVHRVLRPGGRAQVTVWSREAPRFAGLGLPPGPADVQVPWRAGGLAETRLYHLYTPASLRAACREAGFTVVDLDEVAISAGQPDNLVAVLRKA